MEDFPLNNKSVLNRRVFDLVLSLALLSVLTLTNVASAHAAASSTTQPRGCTNTIAYQGNNSDSSLGYTVYLTVHYVKGVGCYSYLYSTAQAYVKQGYSTNIRVCAGHAPEHSHGFEVCSDFAAGSAPLGGWLSPTLNSYHWTFNGCQGYADIINHVGLASNNGC